MLELIIKTVAHLFAKDKSLDGLQKIDDDLDKHITGLNFLVVAKGVGYVIFGLLIFVSFTFLLGLLIR